MQNEKATNRAAVAALEEGPCADCGQTFDPVCMDFDHRPNEPKVKSIARMIGDGHSMATIRLEIEKCDLVCANCHRIRTHRYRK